MLQALLEIFTTEQKAEAMLESPIIELIFMTLFALFFITLIVHLALFIKIRKTRNYVKETNRLDIEPLHTIKTEFDNRQQKEAIKLETFIQEKFSSWRMFQLPIINLIRLVQMTISVFILLGVLGTFIGLTISLGSIQPGNEDLIENVTGVLSGIDVAFYTSIIGMGFSLIMTVLVRTLNTEYVLTDLMLIVESHLESHTQHGMDKMIAVSENIHESIQSLEKTNETALNSIVEAFVGFKDYTSGLQQSAEDLAKFNDGLSENLNDFQDLFGQMKTITDGFSEGTAQLNENFSDLFSYFQKMDRMNERIAEIFEQTYDRIETVTSKQVESLGNFDASLSDLKTFTSSTLDAQADIRETFEQITKRTENVATVINAQTTTFKEIFGDDLTIRLSGIATYLADLNKGFDRVGESIGSLPEALEVISQTQREHQHLLGDRFRELKQFNETFNDHLRNHERETATFEKQLRDATTTFEMLATKNSTLLNEMNRSVADVNNLFSKRDHELAGNISSLTDTLSHHTNALENAFGQKLDSLIRNLDNSLYSLNDGMNRELGDMRRISEEIIQNQARLLQQVMQELTREIQMMNRRTEPFGQQTNQLGQRGDRLEQRPPNRSDWIDPR